MHKIFRSLFLLGICVAPFTSKSAILDSNFNESFFVGVGSSLTGIAWAPDGSDRLFITQKSGTIVIVQNGVQLGSPFATVSPLFTGGECGLLGISFDPNFMENHYVYVFATVSSGEQQIIRYTAAGNTGINKTVLVSGLPTVGNVHNGGGIGIGPDRKIYWSIGDNGTGAGVNGDLTSLASKVGRANIDGTVPSDNPFVDGPGGNNDYIWARGFRNPFTLNFQPVTGELWVNCVGTSYEQVFLVQAGDHAGWNNFENTQPGGFIIPKIKYRTNGTDTRNIAAGSGAVRNSNVVTFTTTSTHGFRQGEKLDITGVSDGSFNGDFYVLSVPSATNFTVQQVGPDDTSGGGSAETLSQGGCVTGGSFYDSTAVPAAYRQNFFFGDLNSGRIMRATLNSTNGITSDDYFGTGSAQQIDIDIGPDGALYYGNLGGTIMRVAYTNITSQQLIVTPTVIRMVEAGTASFMVRLAMAPAVNVSVNVARTSGDADLNVTQGAALTFTPSNWSEPQMVQVEAAVDDDTVEDTAAFTVSGIGMFETVTVHALDLVQPFTLSIISAPGDNPVQLQLSGQPGNTYVLEGTTDLIVPWTALSTNTLVGASTNLTDPGSGSLPIRFYRARLAP